jgi:hypothetical protein
MSRAFAMGQLRHLYAQMVGGAVKNTTHAATGLLGPAIEALELADKAAESALAATPSSPEQHQGDARGDRCTCLYPGRGAHEPGCLELMAAVAAASPTPTPGDRR